MRKGRTMSAVDDPLARQFDMATVAAIAGVELGTLTAWRNRNGLFPETRQPGRRKHQFFSLIDVAKARTVLVMTNHGLTAQDAVTFVQTYLGGHLFAIILKRQGVIGAAADVTRFVGFEAGTPTFHVFRDSQAMIEAMAIMIGVVTIIDLEPVVDHVLDRIERQRAGRSTRPIPGHAIPEPERLTA
jgi:MerR HTH family regulatory protein